MGIKLIFRNSDPFDLHRKISLMGLCIKKSIIMLFEHTNCKFFLRGIGGNLIPHFAYEKYAQNSNWRLPFAKLVLYSLTFNCTFTKTWWKATMHDKSNKTYVRGKQLWTSWRSVIAAIQQVFREKELNFEQCHRLPAFDVPSDQQKIC